MEFWKFESLINNRALYFRRSDRLEDDMEGKYSEANRCYTTDLFRRFLAAYPIQHDPAQFEQASLNFRYSVFINCWHINRVESEDMWATFGKTSDSIVIVSTVRKLLRAVKSAEIQPGRVNYASQAQPRPEWSYYGPFFFKDTRFMHEREFRLIMHPPDGQGVDIAETLGQTVLIEPQGVIDVVKLHPRASDEFKRKVKGLIEACGAKLAVSWSSFRRMPAN